MKITIFTPTYNRAYILNKLYESLCNQKYRDFEWLIVDDGSTDNTKELIKGYIKEKRINIKYFYQENSGKHIAINNGVQNAQGDIFFIVDSDDYLCESALLNIKNCFDKLNNNNKIAGIGGLRIHEDGTIIGKTFSKRKQFIDSSSIDRRKYNILGDKAECFYTNILKNYKFPKIEGEKFISEAYIWNKIAQDGYLIRWYNIPFIVCEYIDDGLTKNRKKIVENNPKGHLIYILDLINVEKNLFRNIAHKSSFYRYGKEYYTDNQIMNKLKIGKIQLFFIKIISRIRR